MIDPIAITLGPLTVRWYGIILGTGALIGLLLAIREGKNSVSLRTFSWICF